MPKKIVVITSSFRPDSNSTNLARELVKGAKENGNEVREIDIKDLNLKYCLGCLYCQNQSALKCALDDSMNEIYETILESDVLVLASPVYYYGLSGQLKVFLDRLNPLYGKKYHFSEVYLVLTAADSDKSAMDGSITMVNGWISCFEGVSLKGVIYGTDETAAGDSKGTLASLEAYRLGLKI